MAKRSEQELRASIAAMLNRALAAHQAGNLDEAEQFYNRVLALEKKQFDALHMLAVLLAQRGNFARSERLFHTALEIKPDYAVGHYNHGNVFLQLQQFTQAIASYDKAVKLNPGYTEAHFNRGNALLKTGRFAEALIGFDHALRLNPNIAEIHSSRGSALRKLKRFDEALICFDTALTLRPGAAACLANRGNVLHELGRLDDALACFNEALASLPDDAELHYNRGNILYEAGRLSESLDSFDQAIELRSGDAEFLHNRGNVLFDLGRLEEALADYDKARAIDPQLNYLEGARLSTKMHLCDWRDLEAECTRLITSIRDGNAASLPFPVLAMDSTPADQLKCAQIYAADRYSTGRGEAGDDRRPSHDRLRIAYLSADFQNHATAQLAAGLFEHHDRSRFMTTAISFGLDDGSAMRARLRNAFDRFVDVSTKSARETADLLREMEIDIAVDLGGYTHCSRTTIVAMRPAPVQVSYLGYPGTIGAPFIDYIIADEIVIPNEHRAFYSEKIAYLPHSYQCNDSKRRISDKKITRAEAGLPDNGFVFCSFNNSYKITPEVFSVWMKLLQQVDGSVLWLLAGNESSPINLKAEAEKRGVSSSRLVFAPKVPVEVHLARHRLADLFLDTLPYNAHTTASDALWSGLPVLTCLGSTFAGRVAASLLTATGIPELITPSLEDYEALALQLAREPSRLASIKAKLASNRDTCPLFDTARCTRHIETAYDQMWKWRQRGEPPATFVVED